MALRRWLIWGTGLTFVVANVAFSIGPVSAAGSKTFKIGVDNAAPKGHDWLYVDFFPRQSLRIHNGDIVDFSWNKGSIDGAHNVALQPAGAAANSFAALDLDDGPGALMFNPVVAAPTDPTCGSAANPCHFDGSKRVNSGFAPTATGNEFFVKIDVSAPKDPVTVNFICEIHPGMHGSLTVAPDSTPSSTPDQVADAAEAQFRADTRGALRAEQEGEDRAESHDSAGQRTVTVIAGTATPFVEVVEMLPRTVEVDRGDKVLFQTTTIRDVHTVTFPQGPGSDGVDPLANVCEASPNDTPAVSPASCANPTLFETHIIAQPQGKFAIDSRTTVGTSGIIANSKATLFPDHFTFSFPNEGRFTYQCRIHDHMIGTIVVGD